MGWIAGAWATGAWAGTAWAVQDAPVTVPDVVGETQAAGTATLEGDGFVVAVETAYSSSVPAGTIISQVPAGGSLAAEGSTVTITVSLGESSGAGKSRRRRRYFVQVDGQDFEVASAEQAKQVLQRAVALAETAAQRQIKPAPLSLKVKPVTVPVPQIATNAPLDLEPYQRAIEAAYAKVAQIEELRRLFEAQARQDDDDAAAMLLLH